MVLPVPESGDCGSTSRIRTNRSVICNFLVWVAYFVKESHLVYTGCYPILVAAPSMAWVYGLSSGWIAGSNSSLHMDASLL